MDPNQIQDDLNFIRRTMEASTRYTNLPPGSYLCAGALGLIGPAVTWLVLGPVKVADPALFSGRDVAVLAVMWAAILAVAGSLAALFMTTRARRLGVPAWTPPARRMFWSQAPVLAAAGVLTLGLFVERAFGLIPGLWLLAYGVALFAFHYYTGKDHLVQAALFLVLGAAATFSPGWLALVLLGLGFGAVNLAYGVKGVGEDRRAR